MKNFLKKYGIFTIFSIYLLCSATPASADWVNGLDLARTFSGLPSTNLVEDVVLNLMLWLLMLFTIIAVIGFIISGIMYITAGANAGLAEQAKKGFVFAIIGTAIGIAGYIIIAQIDELLSF